MNRLLATLAAVLLAVSVGIPVGDQAPGFALEDQAGGTVSLEKLLADLPTGSLQAVLFFRSADW